MNEKKMYLYRLADFLCSNGMTMSGEELANHLNRNKILTSYGTKFVGGQGTYKLISETYKLLNERLSLPIEADKIAKAFVTNDGSYAYKNK